MPENYLLQRILLLCYKAIDDAAFLGVGGGVAAVEAAALGSFDGPAPKGLIFARGRLDNLSLDYFS